MLFKKLLNRTLLSLTGLMVATASQAFDAGASDQTFASLTAWLVELAAISVV